jgi:hypothetical protein
VRVNRSPFPNLADWLPRLAGLDCKSFFLEPDTFGPEDPSPKSCDTPEAKASSLAQQVTTTHRDSPRLGPRSHAMTHTNAQGLGLEEGLGGGLLALQHIVRHGVAAVLGGDAVVRHRALVLVQRLTLRTQITNHRST